MAEYDWVRATDRCRRQVMSFPEADEFLSRSAERLASLQAERDQLDLGVAYWKGLAERDNAREALHVMRLAHREAEERIATLEAQLALCDAVVEAARSEAFRHHEAWMTAHPGVVVLRGFCRCGYTSIAGPISEFHDAVVDASENPRGATP